MPARSLSSTLPWNRLSCCFSFKICVWHFDVVLWWWLVYFLYPFIDGFLFSLWLCVSACLQSQAEKMFYVLVHPYNLHLDIFHDFCPFSLLWVPSTLPTQGLKAPRIDLSRLKHRNRVAPGKRRLGRSGPKNCCQKHLHQTCSIIFQHRQKDQGTLQRETILSKSIEQQHVWIRNNQPFNF